MDIQRPEATYELDNGTKIIMSYVKLNDALRFLGGPDEAIQALLTNSNVRDMTLRLMIADHTRSFDAEEDLPTSADVGEKIGIFEMDDLLAWVLEHVTYFFMKQALSVQKRLSKYSTMLEGTNLKDLNLAPLGSKNLEMKTKSAGPTE